MDDPFGPIQWFDWDAVERHYGTYLPHYEMPGAIYFVTYRLWDSLPADVYQELIDARDAFFLQNPLPHSDEQDRELKKVYLLPMERCLDQGLGKCVLRESAARKIVEDTLLKFDGDRYQVGDFVVMPNHVHVLVRTRRDLRLRAICRQWKDLSAARINHLLGRHGRLWQAEPFDHIVRSPEKLEQCRHYIANNPRNLRDVEFSLAQGMLFGGQLPVEAGGSSTAGSLPGGIREE